MEYHPGVKLDADAIHRNLLYLIKNTRNIDAVIAHLFGKGVINIKENQTLLAKSNEEEKNFELYSYLMKKDTQQFSSHLMEALIETGNDHLINEIFTPVVFSTEGKSSPLKFKWWPHKKDLMHSFVERKIDNKPIIEIINERMNSNAKSVILVDKQTESCNTVCGLGGLGKSTTAIWYGNKYEQNYSHIIWLNCGGENIAKSIKQLAQQLNISFYTTNDVESRPIRQVATDVYNALENDKCLFIFDDVDDSESVRNVLPKCSIHHTLITTRQRYLSSTVEFVKFEVFSMDPFSEQDASLFMRNEINDQLKSDEEQDVLTKIASELAFLPLALQVAVSTINEMNWKPSFYLKNLKERVTLGLTTNNTTEVNNGPISGCLSLAISCISARTGGQLATEILGMLSFLSPNQIPNDLIMSLVNDVTNDDAEFALSILKQFSLISIDRLGFYSIHRLIQTTARMNVNSLFLWKLLHHTWNINENVNLMRNNEEHIWSVWRNLLDDRINCRNMIDYFPEFFISVLKETSKQLELNSLQLVNNSLPDLERIFGPNHVSTLEIKFQFAKSLFKLDKFDNAKEIWEGAALTCSPASTASPIAVNVTIMSIYPSSLREIELIDECFKAAQFNIRTSEVRQEGRSNEIDLITVDFNESFEDKFFRKISELLQLGKISEAWKYYNCKVGIIIPGLILFNDIISVGQAFGNSQDIEKVDTEIHKLKSRTFNSDNNDYHSLDFKLWDKIVPIADRIGAELIETHDLKVFNQIYKDLTHWSCTNFLVDCVDNKLIPVLNNEISLHPEYELLKHVNLHKVIFNKTKRSEEYKFGINEIEISEWLLKYFPNAESLMTEVRLTDRLNLNLNKLPLKMRKLNLRLTTVNIPAILNLNESYSKHQSLKHLILYNVTFDMGETGYIQRHIKAFELSELLNYFPNLEIFHVEAFFRCNEVKLKVNYLPLKITTLKLMRATIIIADNEPQTKYEQLKHLDLSAITFVNSSYKKIEIDLGEWVFKHFPSTQTIDIGGSRYNFPLSLNTYNLPDTLTQMQLSSTTFLDCDNTGNGAIEGHNSSKPLLPKMRKGTHLKSIYLADVLLPNNASEMKKFIGNACENIFLYGCGSLDNKPNASHIQHLIQINSIKFICVRDFDWNLVSESEIENKSNSEIIKWMESVGISKDSRKCFCLQRVEQSVIVNKGSSNQQLWRGRSFHYTEYESVKQKMFYEITRYG